MKSIKLILCILFLLTINVNGQIKLDNQHKQEDKKSSFVSKEDFQNIVGYGMYNATVIGYADFCGFSKNEQEMIYNHYYKQVESSNLNNEEIQIINKNFYITVNEAKTKGVSNSKMTCQQFGKEFNSIITFIKKNN